MRFILAAIVLVLSGASANELPPNEKGDILIALFKYCLTSKNLTTFPIEPISVSFNQSTIGPWNTVTGYIVSGEGVIANSTSFLRTGDVNVTMSSPTVMLSLETNITLDRMLFTFDKFNFLFESPIGIANGAGMQFFLDGTVINICVTPNYKCAVNVTKAEVLELGDFNFQTIPQSYFSVEDEIVLDEFVHNNQDGIKQVINLFLPTALNNFVQSIC